MHEHDHVAARGGADARKGRRFGVVDLVGREARLVVIHGRGGRDYLCEHTLLQLAEAPLACAGRRDLLVDRDCEARASERIERRLHVLDGTSGTALAAHGVESCVLHKHQRIEPERLVELTHTNEQQLIRPLFLLESGELNERAARPCDFVLEAQGVFRRKGRHERYRCRLCQLGKPLPPKGSQLQAALAGR